MIGLIEIAHLAQEKLPKYKELGKGVSFGMKTLPKSYEGTYSELAFYMNNKITMASINSIDNKELYAGCIALYSSMLSIILEKASKE